MNLNSINNYFATRHYLFFGDTCYKNIKILNPGNILTYDLNENSLAKNNFDNPLSWISEKKMFEFNKMSELDVLKYFFRKMHVVAVACNCCTIHCISSIY